MTLKQVSTWFANARSRLKNDFQKTATQEKTAPLKNWLNEHLLNPYPTTDEQILLARISE